MTDLFNLALFFVLKEQNFNHKSRTENPIFILPVSLST